MKTVVLPNSECIKREVNRIDKKINQHRALIRKLESQKIDLLYELRNAEFEEKPQGQFVSRFEVDSFRHND